MDEPLQFTRFRDFESTTSTNFLEYSDDIKFGKKIYQSLKIRDR